MTIKDRLIALLLRCALLVVRGLLWLKPRFASLGLIILLPARIIWIVLLSAAIPLYGSLFALRKRFGDIYQPAKNRVMYLIANRYTVHAVIAVVLLVAFGFNLQANAVRAETFGENSLMYAIVVNEGERFIAEDVALESVAHHAPTAYLSDVGVESYTYGAVQQDSVDDGIFASSSGLSAPRALQGSDSVAPRDGVITYAVAEGDTISGIASKFNISVNTLLWANNLSAGSSIRVGKQLTILPVSGVMYTVGKGETITKIAGQFGVKPDAIYTFNKLDPNQAISIGAKLLIPGGEVRAVASAPSAVGRVFSSPSTGSVKGTPTANSTASPSASGMIWPTDLHIITQYFTWKHTGIDIDCHDTNTNYAAADGVVTFAGWNSSGYGNFVIIDNGNGIVTRYGHHAKLYVSVGDHVKRGQALGMCGTTGHSTGTHLHFEVKLNGKFQNPLEYVH